VCTKRLPFWHIGLTASLLASCTTQFPPLSAYEKPPSHTITENRTNSSIQRVVDPLLADHPNESGVYPLINGVDAFVARLALIRAASTSIDLQYYIYRGDETGQLLTWSLMQAAERGVRVRVLLDDMNTDGKDSALALLSEHPNVEVRLFNPFINRILRGWEFLGNFARANRRMHNKSLTVDGLSTIVGGRNIGDEYFSANQAIDFGDFDLLAIGPVVQEISTQFDLYWNSEPAIPVAALIPSSKSSWSDVKPQIHSVIQRYQHSEYFQELKRANILAELSDQNATIYWGMAYALYDPPSKANPQVHTEAQKSGSLPDRYMLPQLIKLFDNAKHQLVLISPYFVPGRAGVELLTQYREQGVAIDVITNSLAATDVVAVHGGYQKYRKELLLAGIGIREVRVDANVKPGSWKGSSKASLHAKTFYLDNKTLFVGSFNLDPRSAALNTELGIVVDSEELVHWLKTNFNHQLAKTTYRVELEGGKLKWIGEERVYRHEPQVSIWRRIGAALLALLPIEQQL